MTLLTSIASRGSSSRLVILNLWADARTGFVLSGLESNINKSFIVLESNRDRTLLINTYIHKGNNMNGTARNPPGIDLSLTPRQLDLLSTALASSRSSAMPKSNLQSNSLHQEPNPTKPNVASGSSNSNQRQKNLDANLNTTDLYKSPLQDSPSSAMFGSEEFESPLIDYDFDDGIYDWDNSAGLMIGSLPGAANEEEHDLHEKRKSIEDDDENTHKRREGEEKTAKKPGRKPMTGEPTTVRLHEAFCLTVHG